MTNDRLGIRYFRNSPVPLGFCEQNLKSVNLYPSLGIYGSERWLSALLPVSD